MVFYRDLRLDRDIKDIKEKLGLKSSVEVLRMAVNYLKRKIIKEELEEGKE